MKADAPPVQNLINRIFRCRHRRKTVPFTPRGEDECYAVCLDCGQRIVGVNPVFASTAPPRPAAPPSPVVEPPRPVIAAKPVAPANPAPQKPQKSAEPTSKSHRKQKQKARQPLPAAQTKEAVEDSSQHRFSLRDGRFNLLWVALVAIGLSGGLYFSTRPQPPAHALVAPLAHPNAPIGPDPSGASFSHDRVPDERPRAPAVAADIKSAAIGSASGNAPPSEGSADINLKRRLDGTSSPVILGMNAPAVQELAHHPARLPELIQSGSLFTVPRGAAIRVQQERDGVLRVILLGGSMAGREGWVLASQVTPRYRSGEPGRRSSP